MTPSYAEASERLLRSLAAGLPKWYYFSAALAVATLNHESPPPTVVIVGRQDSPLAAALRRAALDVYRPGTVVLAVDPGRHPPWPYPQPPGQPLARVCVGRPCSRWTDDPAALRRLLARLGRTNNAPGVEDDAHEH